MCFPDAGAVPLVRMISGSRERCPGFSHTRPRLSSGLSGLYEGSVR